MYWSDEGDLMALRLGHWKVHFAVQRGEGAAGWQEPLVPLRFPLLVNLRTDPFERAEKDGSLYGWKWRVDHTYALVPFGAMVAQYMATMQEFPPRQTPESWSPAAFLEKLRQQQEALQGNAVK
jgi:arylsulfatase